MKRLIVCLTLIALAHFAAGCGLFGAKTYDGSQAFSEAHPDQAQPMPYMDPDKQYSNDSK